MGWNFLKISVPHSLMTTYQMNLISAGSISLESTFKKAEDATLLPTIHFIFYAVLTTSFNFYSYLPFSPFHFVCSFRTVLVPKNFVSSFAFFSFSPNTSVCVVLPLFPSFLFLSILNIFSFL